MKKGIQNSESPVSSSSKIMFEECDESDYSSEEEEIKRELADVSFEELQKARSNGFRALCLKSKEEKKGRINKNRPSEISSNKPVARFREVIQVPKKVIHDPRFESLCGTLDTDGFKKRYSFLYETQLPAENEELKKLLRKSKDPDVVTDLKNHISVIDKQLKEGPSKFAVDKAILAEHKKRERETAKQGKHPFYLNS